LPSAQEAISQSTISQTTCCCLNKTHVKIIDSNTGRVKIVGEIIDGPSDIDNPISDYKEFAKYGWVEIEGKYVNLFQTLFEVVANDFKLIGFDIATQTTLPIAKEIRNLANPLRELFAAQKEVNEELITAIEALSTATDENKRSILGNLIQQLGNGLSHGANTVTIVQAIKMIAEYL